MVKEQPKSGLQRALLILDHIREISPEPTGVSNLSRDLGIPKAVAHRILKDFVTSGYLAFDEISKQYTLGSHAISLGITAFKSMDIPTVARPHLTELVRLTNETATLSIRQGWSRVYIDQVESPQEIRMAVLLGGQHPLTSGSSSKAILAALPQTELASYFEVAGSLAFSFTHANRAQLETEIVETRNRGFASSLGERQPDAGSVAAPIYDQQGEVWGSISICGPINRFSIEKCEEFGPLVQRAATQISSGIKPFYNYS